MSRFLFYRSSAGWRWARLEACPRREMVKQGNEPAFFIQLFFFERMSIQWLMAARKIGKRLALLEPPAISRLSDESHEVICGVAGCVVRRKNLGRITE